MGKIRHWGNKTARDKTTQTYKRNGYSVHVWTGRFANGKIAYSLVYN